MNVSTEALAELPPDGPWAAYALALAARGAAFSIDVDPAVPLALQVLRGVELEVLSTEESALGDGVWELALGPGEGDVPAELGASGCWSLGGDDSYWRLLVHWRDEPGDALVSRAWVRDEFEHTELGRLDALLSAVALAAVEPESEVLAISSAETVARLVACLREAASLRGKRRETHASLPLAPWESLLSEDGEDATVGEDTPAWARDSVSDAEAEQLLVAVCGKASFSDLSAADQQRTLWALDRRARYHSLYRVKPGRQFPPKPLARLLAEGVASADDDVANAAWFALASLELAGPKKKTWIKRLAEEADAVGLDGEMIGWGLAAPSKLTRLDKLRTPTPSSRLAAAAIHGAGDKRHAERIASYLPVAWIVSGSVSAGGLWYVHSGLLQETGPHPAVLAEHLVTLLKAHVYDPNLERLLGLLVAGGAAPPPVVERVRTLTTAVPRFGVLLAIVTSVEACEAELLCVVDTVASGHSPWSAAVKLLFEHASGAPDDQAALLLRAAHSVGPRAQSIAHFIGQIDTGALTEAGRAAIRTLATHADSDIAAAARAAG